jgi:cyanophycinase
MNGSTASTVDARGFIVAIGGVLPRNGEIVQRFADLCGGKCARIAAISVSPEIDDSGARYERAFRELGVGRVDVIAFENRAACESAESATRDALARAHGVLLVGQDPALLSQTFSGTAIAQQIACRNAEGMHVAGACAGASLLPRQTIIGGAGGTTPRADIVKLAPGLGLMDQLVIDQHFRHQDRLGRMLMALTYTPHAIGIGIDEGTAAFIGPDDVLEVVGGGGITIIDTSRLQHSAIHAERKHAPVSMIGLHLDILVEGSVYDLSAHLASMHS